jgi:hypothetical protein
MEDFTHKHKSRLELLFKTIEMYELNNNEDDKGGHIVKLLI